MHFLNPYPIHEFIQKGVIASLRDFSNISMNHHHGMQSEELAGFNSDLDRDGIVNELTEGDITAITANLNSIITFRYLFAAATAILNSVITFRYIS